MKKMNDQLYWLKLRLRSLRGKFRCPVCNSRVFAFYPLPPMYQEKAEQYGVRPWRNETCNVLAYSCPFCQASDRDRLIALYLGQYFKVQDGKSIALHIVDFAPSAPLSRYIRKMIVQYRPTSEYRTADLYMSGVDDKVDIMDMSIYRDNSIDMFICSHVLEHVSDDRKALGELWRVIKRGGTGVLLVPLDLNRTKTDEDPSVMDVGERWRRFGQDDHVRAYAKADFLERIRGAGFIMREYTCLDAGVDTFLRAGIVVGSVLYLVEKV